MTLSKAVLRLMMPSLAPNCHYSYSDDYDHNAGAQGPTADCRKAQFQSGVHS
jgi:hypothetical protein